MARQPRTRQPKKKFSPESKVTCFCGAPKFLYSTKTGPAWQCSASLSH